MSTTQWIELAVAAIALIIAGLSSWVEISLSATSRVNVRRLLDERYARLDEQEIERAQRVRWSMLLIGLAAAGVAAAAISDVCETLFDAYGTLIGILISVALLIVVGRIWPRVAAGAEPDAESPRVRRIARALCFVFAPIIRPVNWVADLLIGGRGVVAEPELPVGEEQANGQPASEREEGEIEQSEQEMITGVLHLEHATARDIMVPRIDIVAISKGVLVSEAVDVAIGAGHSRIPVYGRNIDEIVGVVYAKDLLRFVNDEHEGIAIDELIRDAYFVPESKRVDDLLSELQKEKIHLAVVVDEYGGTAGVVTIEDILEEIVGEIQDEYDTELPRIELISEDEALVDGALSIDDLSDELDLDWPEPVSGTIGGLIQRRLGRIPAEGEVVGLDDIRLTVLRVERRRVRQVRVQRMRRDATADDEANRAISADTLSK